MKHQNKLVSREHQQQAAEKQSHLEETAREFASPEEMLRFDAERTRAPGGIAEKLSRSLQNEPCAPRSWWKRWLK